MTIVVNRSVTSGEANLKAEMLDLFYPVGSYYETSDTTFDPNTAWGGTWAEDTAGRVLVAVDTGTFDTVGDTGGSEKHHHEFGEQYVTSWADTAGDDTATSGFLYYDQSNVPSIGAHENLETVTVNVNGASSDSYRSVTGRIRRAYGGTKYDSSIQPYTVIKRWHRTA